MATDNVGRKEIACKINISPLVATKATWSVIDDESTQAGDTSLHDNYRWWSVTQQVSLRAFIQQPPLLV